MVAERRHRSPGKPRDRIEGYYMLKSPPVLCNNPYIAHIRKNMFHFSWAGGGGGVGFLSRYCLGGFGGIKGV